MTSLLDQLIREQGDEVAAKVAAKLGIPLEEAAKVLPAAAAALVSQVEAFSNRQGIAEEVAPEPVPAGAGAEMEERIRARTGIGPEQAAAAVPLVLPVILRFLVRRVPGGGIALALLARTVEDQGHGSLDEIAQRFVRNSFPKKPVEGEGSREPAGPSLASRLGRLAGKYFPSEG